MIQVLTMKAPAAINRLRVGAVVAAALAFVAMPAFARDDAPEFSSRVWVENDNEVAALCMNGKELITFRARAGSSSAADEADDLAAKLQDLVADKSFDASRLLPAKDGDKAILKLDGAAALAFVPMSGNDNDASVMDASLKVVNGIRLALGTQILPPNFPDITDRAVLTNASQSFSGRASWYGARFHGRKTSDGSRFDMNGMTAAHRSLPFGTRLLVMNRKTGDSCVVEVNDRGPYVGDRVLDLSRGAARRLNMLSSGVATVDCLVLSSNTN